MNPLTIDRRLPRESVTQALALVALLILGGFAVAGPSGLLTWGESLHQLEQRQADVKVLTAQRDELRNKVKLLDPKGADPDLAGELLRKDLNVVHPDEMVMLLNKQP